MIWRPKPGQRVRLHYRPDVRPFCIFHGRAGTVQRAGCGPGPINAEVLLDPPTTGHRVVVPRGNLIRISGKRTGRPPDR